MQPEELNTISIYSGDPANESPERQIAKERQQRAIQAKLPKFELEPNESFCIPREKIVELHDIYLEMLDNMAGGFKLASQDMRSYMESVVFESYKSELEALQREGAIEARNKNLIYTYKSQFLQANDVKRRFQKAKPNYVKRLMLKAAEIEADMNLAKYRAEISAQEEFLYGEPEGLNDMFELIVDEISPKRKKHFINKHGEQLKSLILKLMLKTQYESTSNEPQEEPQPNKPCADIEAPKSEEPNGPEEPNEDFIEPDADELDELYELEEPDEDAVQEVKGLAAVQVNESAVVMAPMNVEESGAEETPQNNSAEDSEEKGKTNGS